MTQLQEKLTRFQDVTVSAVYYIIKVLFSVALGFFAAKCKLLDDFSPFAMILISVALRSGLHISGCYVGSCFGYLSGPIRLSVFKYVTAITCVYIIHMLFRKNTSKNEWTVLSGVVCFVSGLLFLIFEGLTWLNLMLLIGESMLISCCIYFLNYAVSGFRRNCTLGPRELIAVTVTLLLLLASLHDTAIFGMNVSRMIAHLVLLLAIACFKTSHIALLSSCLGIIMAVIGDGGETIFTAFIVAGLSGCVFIYFSWRFSSVFFVMVYYIVLIFFDQFPWNYGYFLEPIAALGVMAVLPKAKIRSFIKKYIPVREEKNSQNELNDREKLDAIAEQLNEITKKLEHQMDTSVHAVFFHEKEETDLRNSLIQRKLNVKEINFIDDERRIKRCMIQIEKNAELLVDKIVKECVTPFFESTPQFIFKENGDNIDVTVVESEGFLIQCVALCKTKKGEAFCGDNAIGFSPDKQKYYMILADGMGSGKSACVHSAVAIETIKKLLMGRLSVPQALNVFRSSCRVGDESIFTTLDICEIYKSSGKVIFYKSGSYDSFHYSGGSVFIISGGGMPLGLSDRDQIVNQTIQIQNGDYIIMASDGFSAFGNDVQQTIRECRSDEPKIYAENLLKKITAISPAATDDITVMVCKITLPKE